METVPREARLLHYFRAIPLSPLFNAVAIWNARMENIWKGHRENILLEARKLVVGAKTSHTATFSAAARFLHVSIVGENV